MAGQFGSSGEEEVISGINVTPLVDVVLVLLIIFLITAPVIFQSVVQVQLPQAASGEQADSKILQFTLTKDQQLLWDQDKVDWKNLDQRLKAMKLSLAQASAVISADQATPHGTVVRLMDTLRQNGLNRLAIQVNSTH